MEELEDKDTELRNLHMINEKTSKIQSINGSKIQREVSNLKKKLAPRAQSQIGRISKSG